MTETVQSKLSDTRSGERTRLWLEGTRLLAAGFKQGGKYLRAWSDDKLVLTPCTLAQFEKTHRDDRGTISGKGGRPIIDITGPRVAATFKGTHVTVTYGDGKVTIR